MVKSLSVKHLQGGDQFLDLKERPRRSGQRKKKKKKERRRGENLVFVSVGSGDRVPFQIQVLELEQKLERLNIAKVPNEVVSKIEHLQAGFYGRSEFKEVTTTLTVAGKRADLELRAKTSGTFWILLSLIRNSLSSGQVLKSGILCTRL